MMWTNVFKIGGLHNVSWFQFLPSEHELNPSPDRSTRAEQKDVATYLVLSAHLRLQKEGFLSTWTNSFVGPWDPSQGLHNPDENIKLWLFVPGRHSSLADNAQSALSKLRVVASGFWVAPGDSEEVSVALSQALRNSIDRALHGLSYLRFGDVFSKPNPSQSEEYFRKGQPTIEFVFAATEESVFVHVIITAKNVRTLSSGDAQRLLRSSYKNSSHRLPVIVSPHGMRGNLTGFCPNDLVKEVYSSVGNLRTSDGYIGLPSPVSKELGFPMSSRNRYVEVTLGCCPSSSDDTRQTHSNFPVNSRMNHYPESSLGGKGKPKVLPDRLSVRERKFIYPTEAVLVPVLQSAFTRFSLKRFWLQNWIGPSLAGSSLSMHWTGDFDFLGASGYKSDGYHMQIGYNSGNSSSISSTSSASSESDCKMTSRTGDLEADADSLTCRQLGLSSNDQLDYNRQKMGFKRPRTGMGESIGQVGIANDQAGWEWDDDDRGAGMDIQALLSEFGDFGDFFENDALPFGEPPGTAESQALVLPPDCADVDSNPAGMMDVSDNMLLAGGFPSFESFHTVPPVMDESLYKHKEIPMSSVASAPLNQISTSSTGQFDHLLKAEAMMAVAPEYGAVQTATSEISSSLFKSPYLPQSRRVESSNSRTSNYVYSATPPSSDSDGSNDKVLLGSKSCISKNDGSTILQSSKCYTQIQGMKEQHDKRRTANNDDCIKEGVTQSQFSDYGFAKAIKTVQGKKINGRSAAGSVLLTSKKTLLATDVESIMFQAFMCRMRHMFITSNHSSPLSLTKFNGNSIITQMPTEHTLSDNLSLRNEMKKKDVPMRIAGDVDGGILDGHMNAPVGVWRTVGVPKAAKQADSPNIETSSSLPRSSFNEDSLLSYGQRQPLPELLDGIALLAQQAVSFVDLALDSDCGDGPYGWLALQELWRRELSCGPSTIHAGCGGTLASCHSLDIAGVQLADPLSAEILPSSIITLLQSDVKTALKSAFGQLDGPLSVTDWCKGRSQSGDEGTIPVGSPAGSALSEVSNAIDGGKLDDTAQSQDIYSSELLRPTLFVLPSPSILVGYQDDWLKTSPNSLSLWEKAPFEPYALPKNISYSVVCPDIDPLISAAADFFQQLGTVYETCRLGTHLPQSVGNQMEIDSGRLSSSGFLLLDCPQSMKIESNNTSLLGSLSDYFLSLSNGWNVKSYLKSLSRMLKGLKLGSRLHTNQKEGTGSPCAVVYIVCPFPDPTAVLKTVIESSIALGSVSLQSDRDRRSILHSQVARALSSSAAVDEASISQIPVISGFSVPKLVLQVVTIDSIFRITSPTFSELVILKDTAFAVYNKARRLSRGSPSDAFLSSSFSSRSPSVLTPTSSIPGMWKDCIGSRMTGSSLPRESELDASLRTGSWESSWQTPRSGALSCDPSRNRDFYLSDEICYSFEPLFILSEPGSVDHGVSPAFGSTPTASEASKPMPEDGNRGFGQSGSSMEGSSSQNDAGQLDEKALPSLHCCYGWTDDWRWLVCIWTDARGELLDSHIFPFGGISSRQDTKGLQCIFVQVLQQGCQILQACSSPDSASSKPRDFVITRIGSFFELEYQEWQKAIFSAGGPELKKWPIQLRRSVPTAAAASGSNGTSLQQQDLSLIQDRTLSSPSTTLYSSRSKPSTFVKSGIGHNTGIKQMMGGQTISDTQRGLLQWVHSISFASISLDHSLHFIYPSDSLSPGGGNNSTGSLNYVEGFTPVRSLGSTSVSYMLIPSPNMRFLQPNPLQLPTCLTAESPPLAHLLHSKGYVIPLSTGFVVSKSVPSMRRDSSMNAKDEWPSVLAVSLVDYYGGYDIAHDKILRGIMKQGCAGGGSKEARDFEVETHLILESIAAELHALSWMTVSPAYVDRRTALPFHGDMVLRLRRLLHFADKELSRQPDKSHA